MLSEQKNKEDDASPFKIAKKLGRTPKRTTTTRKS